MKFTIMRSKNHNIKIGIVWIIVIVMWLMAGCSKFERNIPDQLMCSPIGAEGCIGFLQDKSIIIEEDIL